MMNKFKIKNLNKGFSFMELMVVVAIMTILIIASMPVFRSFTRGRHIKDAATAIVSALRTARGYAITKRTECEVRILTRAVYIYAKDKSGSWYLVAKGKDIPEHIVIYNINTQRTYDSICVEPITFKALGGAKFSRSIHIFKDEDLEKTLNTFAIPLYPDTGSIPANPTDEQRRWCYTVSILATTGRVKIYDYGRGSPWPNSDI